MHVRVCDACRIENQADATECSECGAPLWPVEDPAAAPVDPPLFRECRFCGERVRWNASRCDSCGRERWNDPDDTELGKALGKEERENADAARAAEQYRRTVSKLGKHAKKRPQE